jgi:hypothetical protein
MPGPNIVGIAVCVGAKMRARLERSPQFPAFASSRGQSASGSACFARIVVVEIAGRLVSENNRRFVGEGSGDCDTLLLTAAQFRRPVTASVAEADRVEELHCAPKIQSVFGEHWQNDIFERRKLREQLYDWKTNPIRSLR